MDSTVIQLDLLLLQASKINPRFKLYKPLKKLDTLTLKIKPYSISKVNKSIIQSINASPYNSNWAIESNQRVKNNSIRGISIIGLLKKIGSWLGISETDKEKERKELKQILDQIKHE